MTPQQLYGQAMQLHQRGRLAEAESLYRRLIAIQPRAFAPLHMLGVLLAQQGRTSEALDAIGQALALNPNDAGALVNYGNVLNLSGRFEEAVTSYDRALVLAPDAATLVNRGNALQGINRRPEALASFEQALTLEPENAQALFKRGVLLGELGRTDEALAAYDRLLALEPNNIEALNNRGYLWWLNKQRYAPAIADLERSLALAPGLAYGPSAVLHLKMHVADWRGLPEKNSSWSRLYGPAARWRGPSCSRRSPMTQEICKHAPKSMREINIHSPPAYRLTIRPPARTVTKSAWAICPANSATRPPPS